VAAVSPYRTPVEVAEAQTRGPSFTARIDGGWAPGLTSYRHGMFGGIILHGRSIDDLQACASAVGIGAEDLGDKLRLTFPPGQTCTVVTDVILE
jgi:hypothetical protein